MKNHKRLKRLKKRIYFQYISGRSPRMTPIINNTKILNKKVDKIIKKIKSFFKYFSK